MAPFPVCLSLKNRKTLVVGTRTPALAIANELRAQLAIVTLIGPVPAEPVTADVILHERPVEVSDLDGCWLVVVAGESETENTRVRDWCEERQIYCYVPANEPSGSWRPDWHSNSQMTTVSSPRVRSSESTGLVSLVGAGPGHPDLLTVRALKLIQSADAIVYDRLVSDPILGLCNRKADFIYAGKAKANHAIPQPSINALLVELAQQHNHVVRLKGGDPFIFGRGGEEIETLADNHVPFQIVPGITAASGCAAFAGIPLTHRDHAQSCIFVTGHLRNGTINLNWQELKDPHQTIVVYMGLTGLDLICKTLIQHGRTPGTPAALIERGTNPDQRVFCSTLEKLPDRVAENHVTAPTMLIIGGVVSLRDKLQWF